jgi:putative redox protein
MSDHADHAPTVVTHLKGACFAVQLRSHTIIVDQPAHAGGEDLGPMPLELLGASLGSCVALYVQRFLQARSLPHEGLRVEVRERKVKAPARVAEFVVRLVLPAPLPGHYAEMLERVVESCPAHNTLAHGAEVTVSIEAPAAVGEAVS